MTITSTKNKFDTRLYDITNAISVRKSSVDQATAYFIKTENTDIIENQLSNPEDDKIKPFFGDVDDLAQHFIRPSYEKIIIEKDYIAFERPPIPGILLDEKLKRPDFSLSDKLDIIKKIAEVVKGSNAANQFLCHGWLNPKNIFILDSGDVYITGWEEYVFTCNALNHLPENSNSKSELDSYVKEYASPEVIKLQNNIDVSSEVYSLGRIFNQLFESERKHNLDYSTLVEKCCHKDPKRRIKIDDFIEKIDELIGKDKDDVINPPTKRGKDKPKTNPWVWAVTAILLLICSNVFLGVGWWKQCHSNAETIAQPKQEEPNNPVDNSDVSTPKIPVNGTDVPKKELSLEEKFNVIYDWECNNNCKTEYIASFENWKPESDNDKNRIEELLQKIQQPPSPPQSSIEKHIALIKNTIVSSNNALFDNTWSSLKEHKKLEELSESQQKQILEALIGAFKQECFKPSSNRNNSLIESVKTIIQDEIVYPESMSNLVVADAAKTNINKLLKELKSKTNSIEQKNYLDCIYRLCESFKGSPDEQLSKFCKDYKNWWERDITIRFEHIAAVCDYKAGGYINSITCNDKSLGCPQFNPKYITFRGNERLIEYSPDLKKPSIKIFNLEPISITFKPRDGIKLDVSCKLNNGYFADTKSEKSFTIYPFIIHNPNTKTSNTKLFAPFIEYNSKIDLTFQSIITGQGEYVEDIYKKAFGDKEYNNIFGTVKKTQSKPKAAVKSKEPAEPKEPAETKAVVESPETAPDQNVNKEK